MEIHLAHYLNRTIHVSIPSLFEDKRPRLFKLVSIEPSGLWLESMDLAARLPPLNDADPGSTVDTAFIPYAKIDYVVDSRHHSSARKGAQAGAPPEASS